MDKLKIELKKNNISIIAVEGFEQLGDVSFQIEKLKVVLVYASSYGRVRYGRVHGSYKYVTKICCE